MRITITVHGHLRHTSTVGQDEFTFTLPDASGVRIRDLLETLNIIEEEIKEVTLDGRRVRMDRMLHGRMRIEFYPKRS